VAKPRSVNPVVSLLRCDWAECTDEPVWLSTEVLSPLWEQHVGSWCTGSCLLLHLSTFACSCGASAAPTAELIWQSVAATG